MAEKRSRKGGKEKDFREALRDLIRISRAVGCDPDLVQGGGGNTSVKTLDGRSILVKASGTSLAEMDEAKGWAELDLEEVRGLLAVKGLSGKSQKERESEVLRLLAGTVKRPGGARPSVESNLHALLARVVIHTHPVGLNAFLCSRESRRRWRRLLAGAGIPGEPLYVPYTDPGYVLASRMEAEIGRYRARHGRPPSVVLLENHGVFVAADEVGPCLALSKRVTDAGRRFIGGGRVNALVFPETVELGDAPRERVSFFMLEPYVRGTLLRAGAAPVLLRRDRSALADEFLRDPHAVREARKGAFTPDQIVYCRTYPLFLDRDPRSWEIAVREYRKARKVDPRVMIVPGRCVYYAAPDLPGLRIVAEVYRATMTAILRSRKAGGPRFLDRRQASFIEGWEVEAFRARLSAGAAKPLKGRVAMVVGASRPEGAEAARLLAEAGATVVAVDRDEDRRSKREKLRSGIASFGGIDILIDACFRRKFLDLLGRPGDPFRLEELFDPLLLGVGRLRLFQGTGPFIALLDAGKGAPKSPAPKGRRGEEGTSVHIFDDAGNMVKAAAARLTPR